MTTFVTHMTEELLAWAWVQLPGHVIRKDPI